MGLLFTLGSRRGEVLEHATAARAGLTAAVGRGIRAVIARGCEGSGHPLTHCPSLTVIMSRRFGRAAED